MMRWKLFKRSFLLGGVAILALAVLPGSWAQPSPQGKREGEGPEGWLKVETRPEGAVLLFDGKAKNGADGNPLTAPQVVPLAPGGHDLKVRLPGFRDWEDSVFVTSGDTMKVIISLGLLWTEEQYRAQEKFATNLGVTLAVLLAFIGLVMK